MARRKKEPEGFHREQISATAELLFTQKGIEQTTMDDIAKTSGYSKATLYVYFKNKEEIVAALVLNSMKLLHMHICNAVLSSESLREKYNKLCLQLVEYQEQYPLYFKLALSEINIDFEDPKSLPVEREIFEVGEEINKEVAKLIQEGIEKKLLRDDIDIPATTFVLWSGLSGLISIASKKKVYIELILGKTKEEFCAYGFETLYRSIAAT